MILGQLFSEAFKDRYGTPPPKVEQREGNRIIRVNTYPNEFEEDLNAIIEREFPRPKPRMGEDGQPRRKRKRVTRKPDQVRFRRN